MALYLSQSAPEAVPHRIGIAVAIVLHVVVLAALLAYAPARRAMFAAAPVMVSYLVTPVVENPTQPPQPLPMKPVAKPAPPRPVEPAPLLAITGQSSAAFETPDPALVKPLPEIQASAPAAPTPAPPLPVMPPSFNAAYLDNPPPPYPAIARRTGEQGRVLLRVLVTASGLAESVDVRTSSGSPRLDTAAQETVRRWRFVPARQGDHAVAAWVLVPINFTLEN